MNRPPARVALLHPGLQFGLALNVTSPGRHSGNPPISSGKLQAFSAKRRPASGADDPRPDISQCPHAPSPLHSTCLAQNARQCWRSQMTMFRTAIARTRIPTVSHTRALRAAASTIRNASQRSARHAPSRERRGAIAWTPSVWRRCAMGTNRISCLGVWKIGTRRAAMRSNRMGATDWHRPYRNRSRAPSCTAMDVS